MKRKHLSKAISQILDRRGLSINLAASDWVWSINSDSALRSHRFSNFLKNLPSLWPTANAPVRLAICLIGYDSITSWTELIEVIEKIAHIKMAKGVTRVSWKKELGRESRQEARALSARTVLCLRDLPGTVDWPTELKTFENFLLSKYPKIGTNALGRGINDIFLDASAWHYLRLSPCLFTHLEGALDMPVLPDSVWARLEATALRDKEKALTDEVDRICESSTNKMFDTAGEPKAALPKATIDLLKSLFSVGKNDIGIRLADFLARSDTHTKLSLAATAILTDGWLAGLLASWCGHLLNFGSIRRENPSMATLSAYISEILEPLAAEMVHIDKTPQQMQQEDWENLFTHLIKQISTPAGTAAVRSLHLWAVHTFGCDPMSSVIFKKDVVLSAVQTNIVWPHEQRRAIEQVSTCTMDERVREQTLVILALGCTGLFRIGDIPCIKVGDINETDEGISVEIDPSHGSHGGKSRAARRLVLLTNHDIAQVVLNFQARRARESKTLQREAVYLFGDPNDRGRLYRFGECTRLVNRLLKDATGDSTVSFHTLRHTCATYRCFELLTMPAAEQAIAPLHRLLHQMAHAGPKTLWSVYFHFPDLAIRVQVDKSEDVRTVTSNEAAFWLKTSPETLRQKRHRSQNSSDSFYFDLICNEAFGQIGAEQSPWLPYHLSAPKIFHGTAATGITFEWIYKSLNALFDESDVDVLASRLSCTLDQIRQLSLAIDASLEQLDMGRDKSMDPPLSETSAPEFCAATAHRALGKLKWSFPVLKSSLLRAVFRHLVWKGRTADARRAADAWRRMYSKQSLSLENRVDPRPLLCLLAAAGFPPQALLVRAQAPSMHLSSINQAQFLRAEHDVVQPMFLGTMSAEVRIEVAKPRRGHPHRYLLIRESLTTSNASMPAAGFRMRNVHGVFFALLVFHHLIHGFRP